MNFRILWDSFVVANDTDEWTPLEIAEHFYELALKERVEGEWIRVEDRMPTEKGWYLIASHERCDVGLLLKGTCFMGHALQFSDVTHWMNLPSPPKQSTPESKGDR